MIPEPSGAPDPQRKRLGQLRAELLGNRRHLFSAVSHAGQTDKPITRHEHRHPARAHDALVISTVYKKEPHVKPSRMVQEEKKRVRAPLPGYHSHNNISTVHKKHPSLSLSLFSLSLSLEISFLALVSWV